MSKDCDGKTGETSCYGRPVVSLSREGYEVAITTLDSFKKAWGGSGPRNGDVLNCGAGTTGPAHGPKTVCSMGLRVEEKLRNYGIFLRSKVDLCNIVIDILFKIQNCASKSNIFFTHFFFI